MNDILDEVRLSRAFATAFYDALVESKVDVPKDVLDKFNALKNLYDYQMNRELS